MGVVDGVDRADGVPCRLRPGPGRLHAQGHGGSRRAPSPARAGAILGWLHPICRGRYRGF